MINTKPTLPTGHQTLQATVISCSHREHYYVITATENNTSAKIVFFYQSRIRLYDEIEIECDLSYSEKYQNYKAAKPKVSNLDELERAKHPVIAELAHLLNDQHYVIEKEDERLSKVPVVYE